MNRTGRFVALFAVALCRLEYATNGATSVIAESPDKRFAVIVERDPSSRGEDGEGEVFIIASPSKERLLHLEDAGGRVAARWNADSRAVIINYSYGRLQGVVLSMLTDDKRGKGAKARIVSLPDLRGWIARDKARPSEGTAWHTRIQKWAPDGSLLVALIAGDIHSANVDADSDWYELRLRLSATGGCTIVRMDRISGSEPAHSTLIWRR